MNIGDRLGAYEIVSRLGAGGMGEVFRAHDTRLGRDVAIKTLPAEFSADPDRLSRFEREARVLASLNHPHIGAIYGVEDAGGLSALVLELVEGETLAERVARGPIPVRDALSIARQIADALEAAHEKSIVHRDLKPANVKITPDGRVKVLDFGLAKIAAGGTGEQGTNLETAAAERTRAGVMLGTTAYMSPEQARGQVVDKRTDIWAFGCVLYEMLSGRMAFGGATMSDCIAAILEREPDWTRLPAATPPAVRRLLGRCLEKDLTRRLHDIGDARVELEDAAGRTTTRPSPRAKVLAAGIVAAIAIAGLGYVAWRRANSSSGSMRLANPVQIAATIGFETLPAWSPDGRTIAYQSDQAGNNDIWIAQIGGAAVNRTADFPGGDEMPRWSPDGTQIAFWSAREGGGVFLMPALGGSARKIGPARPDVAAAAAWAPNGNEIAYPVVGSIAQGRPRLEFLDVRTNAVRTVALQVGVGGCLDMMWSPDGLFIAILQANSYNNQTSRVWTLRLKDQKFTSITGNESVNWSPRWLPDSRTLLYTSNRGGTMDVWQQRITDAGEPAGEAVRVTTGLDVLQIAVAPDGRRMAYAKGTQRLSNVWRLPIVNDRLVAWSDARQLTFDQAWVEAIDVSPDGQRLAIESDRRGNTDVWILPASGGEMQQLTTDPAPDMWPMWSPDGREIAFYSTRAGDREAWIQPVDGGPARQITHSGGLFPRWSHDGRSLFFGSGSISLVSVDGGEPRAIVKGPGLERGTMEFSLAPDGRSFAFASGRPDRRIWRALVDGTDARPLTQGQAGAPSWSRDGRWVYFTTYRDSPGASYQLERPGLNIWRVSSDGSREQPVTQLTGRRGWLGQNIANDGGSLYFTWREDVADIWVMDVVRP